VAALPQPLLHAPKSLVSVIVRTILGAVVGGSGTVVVVGEPFIIEDEKSAHDNSRVG
jgi:hypothetical protein